MLRLPPFELRTPTSLAEAVELLTANQRSPSPSADLGSDASVSPRGTPVRVVAGGTDLWPNLKRRHDQAAVVVSLRQIHDLAAIGQTESGGLSLGATTSLSTVAGNPDVRHRYPALARAVTSISSPVLRNMGTIGGNVCLDTRCTYYNQTEEWRRAIDYCMKESGKVCWVAPGSPRCWAISASDSAPMLVALGATVELVSRRGSRELPLAALYRDDGITYLAKRPDEILTAIKLPADSSAAHCRSSFWKLRRRGAIDFAVLSVATSLWLDDAGLVRDARLVLGAVASFPTRVAAVSELVGHRPDQGNIAAVAAAARRAATPMDNTDFEARWRGVMVERYVAAALSEAAGLPVERLPPQHA